MTATVAKRVEYDPRRMTIVMDGRRFRIHEVGEPLVAVPDAPPSTACKHYVLEDRIKARKPREWA